MDMVEKVARAIGNATGYDWFDDPILANTYGPKATADKQREMTAYAEAAIEAMRPTERDIEFACVAYEAATDEPPKRIGIEAALRATHTEREG